MAGDSAAGRLGPNQPIFGVRKKAIKEGRIPQHWKDKPAKLRQKDRDARWTVKFTKAKPREDGSMPPVDIAIPLFGYQNHISIDRGFGFIRQWAATDAAAYEGARLREGLLDKTNTASGVWADTAYRSAVNEAFLARNGFVSHIHRKKPKGRAMPEAIRQANNAKSKIRSRVEHVSLSRRIGWACSSEPSGSPGQRPRSEWSISSTTSNACCSFEEPQSPEGIGHHKQSYSRCGQIKQPENQQSKSINNARPEENKPLIEVSNWLSNRVFETYDAIIDAACDAWRKLIAQPQTITSIGMRDWQTSVRLHDR